MKNNARGDHVIHTTYALAVYHHVKTFVVSKDVEL